MKTIIRLTMTKKEVIINGNSKRILSQLYVENDERR